MDIYSFSDYRKFLQHWIKSGPQGGRGRNSALAREAQCQPVYFSRILSGRAQLSLEQARNLSNLLELDEAALEYFILLVEYDRAGTTDLKSFFKKRIDRIRIEQRDEQKRIQESGKLTSEHQSTYYSSSQYALVHTAISIPAFQTIDALEKQLRIPRQRLIEILSFLKSCGLAVEKSGRYEIGLNRLHLGRNENLIRQHHTNWRIEAMKALDEGRGAQSEQSVHYSAVVSLSHEDAVKLRDHWIKCLEEFNKVVAPSKEETLRTIVVDFFSPSST